MFSQNFRKRGLWYRSQYNNHRSKYRRRTKPFYLIVGLPDNAVPESMQRIEAALQTNNFRVPRQKIIVNMAQADIRKEGSAHDLPIALGILASSGQVINENLDKYIMGELSLDGSLFRLTI